MDLTVATIGAAHGLRGDVMLSVHTDVPEERFYPGATFATRGLASGNLTLIDARVHKGRLVAHFEGIDDRTAAEQLRGLDLVINSDDVDDEEEDAWYPHQLRGLRALTPEGALLGVVSDLVVGAAQDLLVVSHDGRDVLVPFVSQIVTDVDTDGGIVTIDAPGGLFDDEE